MAISISLAQIDVKLGQEQANLMAVTDLIKEASRRGSQLILLPELWPTGYDLEHASSYTTPVDQGLFADIAELARQYRIDIIGSQLSLISSSQHGNTAVYYNRDGENLGVYHKIHLFGLMEEDQYLTGGDAISIVDTDWGKVGLTICYDLRFPELFRAYAFSGVKAVVIVAEWPKPRLSHWRTLLRARAIENQIFIIACNRVGTTGSTNFFGHSCIIAPDGEAIIEAGEQSGLYTAEIDLEQIDAIRTHMPVFSDRRPDAYSHFTQPLKT